MLLLETRFERLDSCAIINMLTIYDALYEDGR
jgi:hypothetical protein